METVLELVGLEVAAEGRPLLAGIGLELGRGQRVALQGPSGCGKSTLLRAIAGLIDPVAGTVKLHGRRPDELKWPVYRRRNVLVDQRPVLFEGSVRANLERTFRYGSATGAFEEGRARELFSRLGLTPQHLEQEARSLSEGEQQRVCLVRALLVEPAVVLLDEPTSALDEKSVSGVESLLIDESRRRGLAALVATHDPLQSGRLCDRVLDLTRHASARAVHRSPS